MSLKKLVAALAVVGSLFVAGFVTAPPAFAGDTCEGCIEIFDDIDCVTLSETAMHNWKLCEGEDPSGVGFVGTVGTVDTVDTVDPLAVKGAVNAEAFGVDNSGRHNWKRDMAS